MSSRRDTVFRARSRREKRGGVCARRVCVRRALVCDGGVGAECDGRPATRVAWSGDETMCDDRMLGMWLVGVLVNALGLCHCPQNVPG